jgi:hypothetical protein
LLPGAGQQLGRGAYQEPRAAPLLGWEAAIARGLGKEQKMATPATGATEATGPWQGGFSGPGLPALGGAVLIAAQLPDDGAGILVSYSGGIFTRQFWTTGPPVPQIIEILPAGEVKAIRDQVAEQLQSPGSGLDDIPLREFVEAVRLHFEREPSDRFEEAVFGSITQASPGSLQGQVTWPGDVIGTVQGSADGVSAQSHLANIAAGNPAWLRNADLQSLVIALQDALATSATDPLWQQMLTYAEQALP